MVVWLFYTSLALCCVSFGLYAWLVFRLPRPASPATSGGAGDARPQALDPAEVMEKAGEMAAAFAKAGPISTTAVMCLFFLVVAFVASGLVSIGG